MNHPVHAHRQPLARSALLLAAFTASAACLCAVALVFDHASSDPFLRDSAQARLAVARCDGLGHRGARDRCVRGLVLQARVRDADASRPAAVAKAERRGGVKGQPLRPVHWL